MEQRPPHPVGRCFIPLTILLAPHRKRQGSLTETNASIVRRDFVIGYQFQTAPLALPGKEIHEEHVLHNSTRYGHCAKTVVRTETASRLCHSPGKTEMKGTGNINFTCTFDSLFHHRPYRPSPIQNILVGIKAKFIVCSPRCSSALVLEPDSRLRLICDITVESGNGGSSIEQSTYRS